MKTSRVTTKTVAVLLLVCAALAGACSLRAGAPPLAQAPIGSSAAQDPAAQSRARALLSKLPLYFIENRGQEDGQVAYYL